MWNDYRELCISCYFSVSGRGFQADWKFDEYKVKLIIEEVLDRNYIPMPFTVIGGGPDPRMQILLSTSAGYKGQGPSIVEWLRHDVRPHPASRLYQIVEESVRNHIIQVYGNGVELLHEERLSSWPEILYPDYVRPGEH